MTPFGKPAAEVKVADIQRLIDDKVPEGRYLEYKSDIQVSKEQQKALQEHHKHPVDRSWLENRPLMDFGRDNLLEELVAFANADGGVLILGMIETKSKPVTAGGFNPVPDIDGLKQRLRDVIVSCIEPRLPVASVEPVATTESGEGVVILEIEPSRLGPHRVRTTREATIRREDSCVPMTMAEIHDMVIRNARRFDAVSASLEASSKRFQKTFVDTLLPQAPSVYIPPMRMAALTLG
jgi:predicted HTH transcriptional regulator